jgi:hypothetical protein
MQGSHYGMVVLTTLALLLVIGTRPNRLRNRVSCPFVKTLPQKLGTRPAKVHPFLLSTALRHWRNPAVLLHLFGTGIALQQITAQFRRLSPGGRQVVNDLNFASQDSPDVGSRTQSLGWSQRVPALCSYETSSRPEPCPGAGVVHAIHWILYRESFATTDLRLVADDTSHPTHRAVRQRIPYPTFLGISQPHS